MKGKLNMLKIERLKGCRILVRPLGVSVFATPLWGGVLQHHRDFRYPNLGSKFCFWGHFFIRFLLFCILEFL